MPISKLVLVLTVLVVAVPLLTVAHPAVSASPPAKTNPSAALLQCGGYLDRLSHDKEGEEQDHYRILARRFVAAGNALGDFSGMTAAEQRRRFELGRAIYDSDVKDDFARKCPVFEPLVNQTMKALADDRSNSSYRGTL